MSWVAKDPLTCCDKRGYGESKGSRDDCQIRSGGSDQRQRSSRYEVGQCLSGSAARSSVRIRDNRHSDHDAAGSHIDAGDVVDCGAHSRGQLWFDVSYKGGFVRADNGRIVGIKLEAELHRVGSRIDRPWGSIRITMTKQRGTAVMS